MELLPDDLKHYEAPWPQTPLHLVNAALAVICLGVVAALALLALHLA